MDEHNDPPQPKAEAAPAKLTADELVKKHLDDLAGKKSDEIPETHQLVSEFMDAQKLTSWQRRAFLARFHGVGLHRFSRIHPEVFTAALSEALKGRV